MYNQPRFRNTMASQCLSLGYPWEEIEDLLIYSMYLSKRGLSFHFALNKKEIMSTCMGTVFEMYNDYTDFERKDRLNLIKWHMKNRVATMFEYHGAQCRRCNDVDLEELSPYLADRCGNDSKDFMDLVMKQSSALTKAVFKVVVEEDGIDFFDTGRVKWKSVLDRLGINRYTLSKALDEIGSLHKDYIS